MESSKEKGESSGEEVYENDFHGEFEVKYISDQLIIKNTVTNKEKR